MFTTNNEAQFFLSHLNPIQKVLEYGSGNSTLEISKRVSTVVSVEHQQNWYNFVNDKKPENCTLIHKNPNLPYQEGGHCGTMDEFFDYVHAPIEYAPYDIILIDGRARVACASIANKLGMASSLIFIHDFHRPEYLDALKYLNLIEIVETMAKFTIKQ